MLGKFAYWNRRFEIEVSTRSSMAWVGETVIGSFSRPCHHRGIVPLWVQVSSSRPYIRGGNVLETCGNFFD